MPPTTNAILPMPDLPWDVRLFYIGPDASTGRNSTDQEMYSTTARARPSRMNQKMRQPVDSHGQAGLLVRLFFLDALFDLVPVLAVGPRGIDAPSRLSALPKAASASSMSQQRQRQFPPEA